MVKGVDTTVYSIREWSSALEQVFTMAYRIMFLVIAASLAALLLNAGGTVNSIAAIIVAGGARPFYQSMWRVFSDAGADEALSVVGHHLAHRNSTATDEAQQVPQD